MSSPVAPTNLQLADFLFQNHWHELVAFLRRGLCGNLSQAEDLSAEAITRIASAQRSYEPERARSLLFSVARNLLIDHVRSERTRDSSIMALSVVEHDVDTICPLQTLMWREDLDRTKAAILALPDRCRQVFVLSRFEGMSYASIARHCGISVSMVEKHLTKALRLIALAIEDAQERPASNRLGG